MRIRLPFALLAAIAFACTMHAAPAQAQRVFVSATGSDGNPCTFALPCRTFQHAHDTAPDKGEIDVLDPAGYGAATITKSISIQGHGYAGITVASGANGITITGDGVVVTLNGLIIDGAFAGYNGIVFNSGANLTVSNCVAQNFITNHNNNTGNGILIQPMSGTVNFVITDTLVSGSSAGISYYPPSGSTAITNGTIDHVVATNNTVGILIFPVFASGGTTFVAISNSVITNNSEGLMFDNESFPLTVSVNNVSVVSNGNQGINAANTTKVLLGRSVITGNGMGIFNNTNSPNTFYTYGDNRINLNGTDICSGSSCSPLNTTFTTQ